MATSSPTPHILIESRYWVLNARLNEPAPTKEQLAAVTAHFSGRKMTRKDFVLETARHPLDNYTEVTTLLRIRLEPGITARLNETYCSQWKALSLPTFHFISPTSRSFAVTRSFRLILR